MTTINVSVSKQKVYAEVGRMSAYLGQRKGGADTSAYARVGVTASDGALLDNYWDMARSMLLEQLWQYAGIGDTADTNGIGDTADTWTLNLVARGRYNTAMTPCLADDARGYIVNYMMSLWCGVCSDGEAQYYLGVAGTLLQDMKNKLCSFTRPKRKTITSA